MRTVTTFNEVDECWHLGHQ